jgi:hypothetical protein
MKNSTAQTVATLGIAWLDARDARVAAKRARNKKAAEWYDSDEGVERNDMEEEDHAALAAYTATEQAAYKAAVIADTAARARFKSAAGKAKKEMEDEPAPAPGVVVIAKPEVIGNA